MTTTRFVLTAEPKFETLAWFTHTHTHISIKIPCWLFMAEAQFQFSRCERLLQVMTDKPRPPH